MVVLDNARIHHSDFLKPFLEENCPFLELVFLPAYSPDLNMIEELWKWVKETVVNNVFYENTMKLTGAVKRFFKHINEHPEVARDRLCLQF